MPFRITTTPGAVFVVWGRPELSDFEAVQSTCQRLFRKHKTSLLFVARVPKAAPAPTFEQQQYLRSNIQKLYSICSSYHVVLEADGFAAAAKRAVLIGMFQVTGYSRFFVHHRLEEVLSKVAAENAPIAEQLLQKASSCGLHSCPPPEISEHVGEEA